jgi:outer membrane protein assembly factor BamB
LIGEEESDRAVYGTPAVADGNVFVGGYDRVLYSYDLLGEERWEEPLDGRIVGGPAVAGDLVIVGVALDDPDDGRQGTLYAFEADTGDSEWSFSTEGPIWSAPSVSDGIVYFGTLGKTIFAVSVADGREVWRFDTEGAVVAPPLIEGGRLYVGDFNSVFYALDAGTGDEVWRFDGAQRWYWSKALAHEGTIYASSLDGNLYALEAASGGLRWTFETEGAIVGSPVVVGGMIIVPVADGDDSKISVVELNGSSSEACKIGDDIQTPLVADGDLIYFGVRDHSIRALRIKTGGNPDEKWVYFTDRDDPNPRERAKAC